MTDEQMETRLRAAGERWRDANTAVAEPTEPGEVEIAPSVTSSRHRNWWAIASAAVVVAALALGGVLFARNTNNDNSASKNVALTGVTWTDPHSSGAVVFLDDVARLTGFCGTTTLPLKVVGDRLTIGTKALGIASGCTDPAIKRAHVQQRRYDDQRRALTRFLRIVHGPATWSISGDRLTVTKSGVGAIMLVTNGVPAPQLVGTQWRLTGYYDGATTSRRRISGRPVDFHIDADGTFVASDDCGLITGTASAGRDRVRFVSKSTCIDPGFSPPSAVVDAVLSTSVSYTINGDQLLLDAGRAELTYRALPTPPTDPAGQLFGSWRLETITQGGGQSHVIGDTTLTFDRSGGFYVGRGCPGFNARVEVSEQRLTISGGAAAAGPMCPSNYTHLQRQEDSTVDSVLGQSGTVGWGAVDDQLAITRDGTQLTFVKAIRSVATSLVGRWHLDTLGYGGGSSGGGSTATTDTALTFRRDGSFVSNHRCYEMRGNASSSGSAITFSGQHRVTRYCASDPDAAAHHREDAAVDSVLTGTATWSLSGDQLTIKHGNSELTFTKTGGGTPIADTDILTGRSWSLYEIGASPADNTPGFTFSDNRIATFCGSSAKMTLLPAQMTDIGTWDVAQDPNCKDFTSAEQHVVYRKILTGSVSWRIDGDTLTITKSGVGKLTFVKTH
jgi:heat shock protein HslJ